MRRIFAAASAISLIGLMAGSANARPQKYRVQDCFDSEGRHRCVSMFGNPFMPMFQQATPPRKRYAPRRRVEQQRYARKVKKPHVPRGMVLIKSRSGAMAVVSEKAAPQFRAFISDLEARGYPIYVMHGFGRPGDCVRPYQRHQCGEAVDINQRARGVVTVPFPKGTTALANKHGLKSGAEWRNDDTGHFEIKRFAAVPATKHVPISRLIPLPREKPAKVLALESEQLKEAAQAERYDDFSAVRAEASPARVALRPEPIQAEDRASIFARYLQTFEIIVRRGVREVEELPRRLKVLLADAADHFGCPAIINSAFRDWHHNRRVGGAPNSQHLEKRAADFRMKCVDSDKLYAYVKPQAGINGIGYYGKKGHVHVDTRPSKKQVAWHGSKKKRYAKKPGKRYRLAMR